MLSAIQLPRLAFVPALGALDVIMVDQDGAQPSASNPIPIDFRSPTETGGGIERASLISPSIITIPNGATLGVPKPNQPFKIWVVEFNADGAVIPGVINCANGGGGFGTSTATFYPLKGRGIASSVQIGVASDAESVFYTAGAAVLNAPYTVIGYFVYAGGLASIGDWASAPTHVQGFEPGVALPGQVDFTHVYERNGTAASGAGAISLTGTPLVTDGAMFMDNPVTPKVPACLIRCRLSAEFNVSVNNEAVSMALFRDSAFLGAVGTHVRVNGIHLLTMERAFHYPGGNSIVLSMRAGATTPGVVTNFNSLSGAPLYGGAAASYMLVDEVAM